MGGWVGGQEGWEAGWGVGPRPERTLPGAAGRLLPDALRAGGWVNRKGGRLGGGWVRALSARCLVQLAASYLTRYGRVGVSKKGGRLGWGGVGLGLACGGEDGGQRAGGHMVMRTVHLSCMLLMGHGFFSVLGHSD